MTDNSDISAIGLIRRMVKDITSRPIVVGTVLTGLGSILTFCVIFTYLHAIGYPVLLGAALGTTTALIPWIVIATLALYFADLMATSAFYASALAFFNRTLGIQPYMAIMLALPALAGITTMVTSIILGQHPSAFVAVSTSGITVPISLRFHPRVYCRERWCGTMAVLQSNRPCCLRDERFRLCGHDG